MDSFGFAHLRIPQKGKSGRCSIKGYLKRNYSVAKDFESKSSAQKDAFSRLYLPVNTPLCKFQAELAVKAMKINVLVALPKAMDSFLVGLIIAFNFKRWFSTKKVLFITSSSEKAYKLKEEFIARTGYPESETWVYGATKKMQRLEWSIRSVIFGTAENLLVDLKGPFGHDIGLLIIDDAERAAIGSHSICILIRNLFLAKACFRILAFTNNHLNKAALLQSIVMNLQIGYVQSTGQLRNEMLLLVSSPRLISEFIPVTEEVHLIATVLLQVMTPLIGVLYDSSVLPTKDHRKLVNFSLNYLRSKLNKKPPYLSSVFDDLLDLFEVLDILMCEGLTAFVLDLQDKVSKNRNICQIVEENDVFKTTGILMSDLSLNGIQFHKLDKCFDLIERTIFTYRNDKSVIVILCRTRNASWLEGFTTAIADKFRQKRMNIICGEPGYGNIRTLSPSSMKFGTCNLVVIPCNSERFNLDIGYVDTLICLDEGLSLLYYISGISVGNEGKIYSLCTLGYEVNVCELDSETYTMDTVEASLVNAVNLCKDNTRIFPSDWNPEVLEYWADSDYSKRTGFLSTYEEIFVNERLGLEGGIEEAFKETLSSREFILLHAEDNLMWLDKPQPFKEVNAGVTTLRLTQIIGTNEDDLNVESERLRKEVLADDSFDAVIKELSVSSVLSSSVDDIPNAPARFNRAPRNSKGKVWARAPPIYRLESSSISSLLMKTNEITNEYFFDPLESSPAYVERTTQMKKIIANLKRVMLA